MRRAFRIIIIVLVSLMALVAAGYFWLRHETKKASPEAVVTYTEGDMTINIEYCRPSAKGRDIFGGLVPFGETWRTGANEATVFECNKDLNINGKKLPAGHYTLWTIPDVNEWKVIWNAKDYPWGVTMDRQASRDPDYDMLMVAATPISVSAVTDTFTIHLESDILSFSWDKTRVEVLVEDAAE